MSPLRASEESVGGILSFSEDEELSEDARLLQEAMLLSLSDSNDDMAIPRRKHEEFKLDKVIGYLQKGHRVKMMITEKEPWNFNRATCEAKLKEILDKLDPECYSVQQAEVLVPSLAAFGCVIQPKTNYFKKAKADMQKEEEQTQQKE